MPKKVFNPTSRSYGNPNKVVSVNNNTYEIATNREKFIRSFAPMSLEQKQVKQWSAPTSMAFVTAQQTFVTIGKDVIDQKTENVVAPATVSPVVTVENATHNTITLSLEKPSIGTLTGYLVETYIGNSLISTNNYTLDGSYTIVNVGNLTALTTYTLNVYSTNVGGSKSQTPTVVSPVYTLPSPPLFSVLNIQPTSFAVSFSTPPNDIVCDISLANADGTIVRTISNYVSGTSIVGLSVGTQYSVLVRARSVDSQGIYTGLISLPTQTNVWTLLNAPVINSLASTTTSISVGFTSSGTAGSGAYQNSSLQTRVSDSGSLVSTISTSSASTISVSGLTADTAYDLSLVSQYAYTKTEPATATRYTFPVSPNLSVSVLNNNSAQLSFSQLFNHVYDVSAIPVSGAVINLHNIGSPYILNSLTPSMSYQVVGTSKFLTSGFVSSPTTINFITTATPPVISSIEVNSDVSAVLHYSVMGATASSDALSTVRIVLKSRAVGANPIIFNTTNVTTATLTGLTPNTLYDLSMISIYANNQSDVTTTTLTTQPSIPTGLTISNLSFTSTRIFFSPIAGLAYDVSAIPNVLGGGANFMSQTDISSGYTITGLSEGTSYNVFLYARNASIRSRPAIQSSVITLLSAPTGLSISNLSFTSLRLNYTPVSGLAYDVAWSNYSGNVGSLTNIASGQLFNGLEEGTTYTFSLTARKDRSSDPTAISSTTLLNSPTDLSINSIDFTSFVVNFTQLPSIYHYDISAIPASVDATRIEFEGVNNGNLISGLTQGMYYTVYLHAHTRDVKSQPTIKTFITLLQSPTGVFVSDISYDSVNVNFDQITGYTYTVALSSITNSLTYLDVNSGDRLTNLSQGTSYTLNITANTPDQVSAPTTVEFDTILNSSAGLTVVPGFTTCLLTFEETPGLFYDVSAIPLTEGNNSVELVDISSGVVVTGLTEGAYYTIYLTTYTADIRTDPATIDFNTLLPSPSNLTISDISFTLAKVTFTQDPRLTYTLQTATNETGGLVFDEFPSGETIEGLPQGLLIDVYLQATSPDYITSIPASTFFRTLLDSPKNVLASNVGTDNFTMYFNPPFPNPEYNIYYDSSAINLVNNAVLSWPNVYTGYVAYGLTEGSPYRLFVNAWTDDEAYSLPSTYDFVTQISMPTGLSSTDVSFKSFRVLFSLLFGFNYDISAVPTSGPIVSATDISSGYLFDGTLQEGMTYTVQLYAKTAYIRSPPATLSVTTTLSPPQNVSISDVSFTSFSVNYTQNVLYQYDVAVFDLSDVKLVEKTGVNSGVSISSADSASIVEGQRYVVKVYARSSFQISVPTTVNATTLLSTPTGLNISDIGFYNFNVNFTQLPGLIYDVSAVSDAGVMVQSSNVNSGVTINVATQGILYNVFVKARTAFQTSLSSSTTIITNLEAPSNFYVDTITFTSVKLHFDVSFGLVYDLSAIHSDGTITRVENVTPAQVITGLSQGVAYSFYLYGKRYGYKYSTPAVTTAITLLEAPTGLNVSDISMTSFRVNFNALAGLSYDATVSNGSSDIHTITSIQSGDIVSGLLEGENYSVSLVAKTVAQTSNATTTTAITLLSSPTGVSISNISYTGFAVTLNSVSGLVYDVSAIARSNSNRTQVVGYSVGSPITVPYDGVTYDVYVYARSPHIRSAPTSTTVTTLLHEPTGVVVSQIQNTSVYYTFTTVAGLTYTSVFHPSSGVDVSFSNATPNVTVTGLISATSYTLSLYAVSAYTISAPTNVTFVTYTNAPAKTDLTSTETSITLSYFPFSADTDTGAFVQTDLQAVPRGGVGSTKTAVGDLTSATVSTLTRGVVYDLSLVATYANTKSMPLLDNYNTIVTSPVGLSVSGIQNTSCVVSFTTSVDLTYDLSAVPVGGVGSTVETPGFVSGSTVTGLSAGTSYTVYVRGYTVGGIYSPFASTTFITLLGSITNVTTSSTETTMTLNYTTPTATSDSGALTETKVAGVSRTNSAVSYASGNATTAQLTGLVVGTVYDISMIAMYANTTSLTNTLVANTGVSTPTNVSATTTGATTASVSYDVVGGYTYDISAVPLGGVGTTVTLINHVYETELTGLTNATKYRVYVYAKSGGFRSSPAYADIVTYFSAGVTNGGVVADETQLTISYSYPTTTADSGAFQKVVIGAQSRTDGSKTTLESSASPAIYGGLVKGTIYDISMIALYAHTQSAITTFTTNTTVDQPTGLSIVSKSDVALTVSSATFSDVVYDLSAIPTSGTTATATDISSGTMNSGYTFTGLVAGRQYTVYVRARVGTVASTYANIVSTLLTPALTLTTGTITATSIAIGYSGATVVANSGSFVNVTGTATNVDDSLDVVNATATTTPITFTGLRQGAKYNIVVVANFANTTSVPATSSGLVTLITAPSAVTVTTSAITDNTSSATFTEDAGYTYDISAVMVTSASTQIKYVGVSSGDLLTGLSQATRYYFYLFKKSAYATSPSSVASSAFYTKTSSIPYSTITPYGGAFLVAYNTITTVAESGALSSVAYSAVPTSGGTTVTGTVSSGLASSFMISGLESAISYDLSYSFTFVNTTSMATTVAGQTTNNTMLLLKNKSTTTVGTADVTGVYPIANSGTTLVSNVSRGNVYSLSSSSYLRTTGSPLRGNMTVAFWVLYDTIANTSSFSFIRSEWLPFYFTGGKLGFNLNFPDTSINIVESTVSSDIGRWMHYAVTTDLATQTATIYKNGVLDTIWTDTNNDTLIQSTTIGWGRMDLFNTNNFALMFGNTTGTYTPYLTPFQNFQIDDVQIYSRAYSGTEIATMFAYGLMVDKPVYSTTSTATTITATFTMFSGYTYDASITPSGGSATVTTGVVSPLEFTGLDTNVQYTIAITANYAGKTATHSATVGTTFEAPTGLTFVSNTTTSIAIAWTAPAGGTPTGYKCYIVPTSGGSPVMVSSATTSVTFTGLTAGTEYSMTVVATSSNGDSAASSALVYGTVLSPPTGLTSSNISETSFTLGFTNPVVSSGLSVTSYIATCVPSSGTTVVVPFTTSDTTTGITGLVANTSYTVTMTATYVYGTSSSSSSASVTTLMAAPSNLAKSLNDNSTITITYTDPNSASTVFYDVSASATADSSRIYNQRFLPRVINNATFGAFSVFNASSTALAGAIGCAVSSSLLSNRLFINASNSSLYFRRFTSGSWGALTQIVGLPAISGGRTYNRPVLSNDGTRLVFTVGTWGGSGASADNVLYYANTTTLLNNGTNSLTFTAFESTASRAYTYMAMSNDGSMLVVSGFSNNIIWYSTWTGSGYSGLLTGLSTPFPLGSVAFNNNRLGYVNNTTFDMYWSLWTGSSFIPGTFICRSPFTLNAIAFHKGNHDLLIAIQPNNATTGHLYSVWNGYNYSELLPLPTTSISTGAINNIDIDDAGVIFWGGYAAPGNAAITYTSAITLSTSVRTSYTIHGLQLVDASYSIALKSSTATTSTLYSQPFISGTTTLAPTNITISNVTPTSLQANFTPPSGNVLSYTFSAVPLSGTTVSGTFSEQNFVVITGLVANTSYNISISAVNAYGASPPVSIVTETNPVAITNLSSTAQDVNTINLSYADTNKNAVSYDISATNLFNTTSQFNQRSYPYTANVAPTFVAVSTLISGAGITYSKGLAVTRLLTVPATSNSSMAVMLISNNTTTTAGISYSRFINNTWGATSALTLSLVTTHSPTNPNVNALAVTSGCERIVIAYGSYVASPTFSSATNQIYWANASGLLNATPQTTVSFNNVENVSRGYLSIALSDDGSKLVASDNNAGVASVVYCSTWDGTNYTTLIPILDTTTRVCWGVALSADGNKLVYSGGNSIYWSVWNGTNYTAGTLIGTSSNIPYDIAMNKNTDTIIITPNGTQPQYSVWTGTGYGTITNTSTYTFAGVVFSMTISDQNIVYYTPYTTTSTDVSTTRMTQTLTHRVSFGTAVTAVTGSANLLYCMGMALSTVGTNKLALFSTGAASGNTFGLYYSRNTGGGWGASAKLTTILDISNSPATPYMMSVSLRNDGRRCVLSYGSVDTNNNFIYWADTSGVLAGTSTTVTLRRINDGTPRNYKSIALSGDGNRLVACNMNATSTGYVYFSLWNSAIDNYGILTPILDTTLRTLRACALSPDGNTLVYADSTNTVYWSAWTGSNYMLGNTSLGSAGNTVGALDFIGTSSNYLLCVPTTGAPLISKWNGSGYTQLQTIASGFVPTGTAYGVWSDDTTIYYTPYATTGSPVCSTYSITYSSLTPTLVQLDTSANYNITAFVNNNAGPSFSSNVVTINTTYPPDAPIFTSTIYGGIIDLSYTALTDSTKYGSITTVRASARNGSFTSYATNTAATGTIRLSGLTGLTTYDVSMSVVYAKLNSKQGAVSQITTSALMMQLYNKSSTFPTSDIASNTITNSGSSMVNDSIRGFVFNTPATGFFTITPSPIRKNFTVTFWIKYNGESMVGVLTSIWFPVYFDKDGLLNAVIYWTNGPAIKDNTVKTYGGEWVHYAITVQTGDTSGNAFLYKNGVLVGSVLNNNMLTSAGNWGAVDNNSSGGYRVGWPSGHLGSNFTNANNGAVIQYDDIRAYSTSYSAVDISNIFTSGLGSYVAPQNLAASNVVDTSFVLYFQMLSNTCIGRPIFNGTVSDGTNVLTLTDISSGYVVSGLTASTAYTVTLNYTLNGVNSPNATLSVTTASAPSVPTGLSITGTNTRSVTVGFTANTSALYYDISATTGSTQVSQRIFPRSYTDISMNSTTNIITNKMMNSRGIAVTADGPVRLMFITGTADTTLSQYGIMCSRCVNGVWGPAFYPALQFDVLPSTNTTLTERAQSIAVTPDGSRMVVSIGPENSNTHLLYLGDVRPLLYGVQNKIDLVYQNLIGKRSIFTAALALNGVRLVFSANMDGAFRVSNFSGGKYQAVSQTITTGNSLYGIAVSSDGTKLIAALTKALQYYLWNGTTYVLQNTLTVGSASDINHVSFLGENSDIALIGSVATEGTYYSLFNPNANSYSTAVRVPTTLMTNTSNYWGIVADASFIYRAVTNTTNVTRTQFSYLSLANRTSYTVYNLTAGSVYNFQMATTNASYLSSSYSSALTLTPVAAPTFTSSVTATSITLNYTATAGTGLTVYATAVTGATVFLQSATTTTGTITFSGLTTGTPYDVSMAAYYTSSWSPSSTKVTITPVVSPLHRYTFDSTTVSGTSVKNISTGTFDATISSATLDNTIFKYSDNSLKSTTTGAGQFMLSMPGVILNFNTGFTICFWFYSTKSQLHECCSYLFNANSPTLRVFIVSGATGQDINIGGSSYSIAPTANAAINTWIHCCVKASAGVVYLYLNGVLRGSVNPGMGNSNYTASLHRLGDWRAPARADSQYIADYRFYNVALTDTQITSVMNNTM